MWIMLTSRYRGMRWWGYMNVLTTRSFKRSYRKSGAAMRSGFILLKIAYANMPRPNRGIRMEKITVGMPITDASAGEINIVSIFAQQPPIFRISRYKIGKQVNERSFIFIKKPAACQEKNRPYSSVNLLSLSNINMVSFQVLDFFYDFSPIQLKISHWFCLNEIQLTGRWFFLINP